MSRFSPPEGHQTRRAHMSLMPMFPSVFVWFCLSLFIPDHDDRDPATLCGSWVFFIFRCFQMSLKGGPMKKILKTFLRGLIFCLSRDLPLEGRKPFTRTLTIEYTSSGTFLSGGGSPSRMKVRQDPSALPGYNGKKGGERFRTILKYPIATDMAMKRYRVNDTSLRSWRRTRQG